MRIIKKYKNRKLYDTKESTYVNLPDLLSMPTGSFQILDSETGKDITDNVLMSALFGHLQENPGKFETVKQVLLNLTK